MYQLDPLSTFEIIPAAVVVVSGVSLIPAIIGAVVGVLLARITPGVGLQMGRVAGPVGGPLVPDFLAASQSGQSQGRYQLSKRGNARLHYAFWLACPS